VYRGLGTALDEGLADEARLGRQALDDTDLSAAVTRFADGDGDEPNDR
jgi:hypothetical protein